MQEQKDAFDIHPRSELGEGTTTSAWNGEERRRLVDHIREFEVLLETFRSIRQNRVCLPGNS